MTFNELLKEKKKYFDILKKENKLSSKNKILGIINIKDENTLKGIIPGLQVLPINFIIVGNIEGINNTENISFIKSKDSVEKKKIGFDFFVCDECSGNMSENFSKGIVPIVKHDSHMSSILKEYDAMKNEGNCFLYENDNNSWDINYSIIRYLENSKFIMDKNNLIKNLYEM